MLINKISPAVTYVIIVMPWLQSSTIATQNLQQLLGLCAVNKEDWFCDNRVIVLLSF